MKQQDEYTAQDRIYGAWLDVLNRVNKIDYHQHQKGEFYAQMKDLAEQYRALTGESIKLG